VNYKDFKNEQPALKSYLKDLYAVKPTEFNGWSGSDQLSYLINLYNAATIDTYSLDDVEHKLIRAKYNEPRIHFALNCASAGCPPLRAEAFTGAKLETQLAEQTVAFLGDKSKNQISSKSLALSPIFDWFKDDFIKKSGSVEAFLDPYFPKAKIKKGKAKISYTDYGWDLNES